MKAMKKMVLVMVAVCLLGSLMAPGAEAGWLFNARIQSVGVVGTQVFILITDTNAGVTNIWFVAEAAQQNALLASALTAVSLGATCQAYVSANTAYSTLSQLYILSQ
jgi:hypothetical protein